MTFAIDNWSRYGLVTGPPTNVSTVAILFIFCRAVIALTSAPRDWRAMIRCFSRIQNFITLPAARDRRNIESQLAKVRNARTPTIQFQNASVAAIEGGDTVLRDVDIRLVSNTLNTVTGASGTGKSTFLQTILGESTILNGSIEVDECVIGYCGQRNWIQKGTIRENIVGHGQFNRKWYQKVLGVCCLIEDIYKLEGRDGYMVGRNEMKLDSSFFQRLVS